MAKREKSLEELVKELPPDLQEEVWDFVGFLVEKKVKTRKRRRFALSWAGILSEYKDRFTALELQKRPWSGGWTVRTSEVSPGHEHIP